MQTLLKASWLRSYAPASAGFDAGAACTFIVQEEEHLFRKCLGWEFYLELLANQNDYSTLRLFRANTAYVVGDRVVDSSGIVAYECIQNTTGTQTLANEAYFTVLPIFANPAYDFIWNRYLASLIAKRVSMSMAVNVSIQLGAHGAVRPKGDLFEAATTKEIEAFKSGSATDADKILELLQAYMLDHPDDFATSAVVIRSRENKLCKSSKDPCGMVGKTRKNLGFLLP